MRVELVSENLHGSLIDLLCELHAYYNEGSVVSRELVREHLLGNLLADGSPHRLVVAFDNDGVVGSVRFGERLLPHRLARQGIECQGHRFLRGSWCWASGRQAQLQAIRTQHESARL